jgi:hypothetical protein
VFYCVIWNEIRVVSVVDGFRNMSVSRLGGFWIINRSRKLMNPLFSYVGLGFIYVGVSGLCVY